MPKWGPRWACPRAVSGRPAPAACASSGGNSRIRYQKPPPPLKTMRDQDRRDHVPDEADEAALEAGLRDAAARFDPVPAELIQAAVAAFSWRTADAELAALAFDSLLDQAGDALVRSAGGPRLLAFQAGQLTIEVEVTGTGSSRELVGQLIPAQRAGLEIRHGTRADRIAARSEERRVGKECRSRWAPAH